MLSVALIELRRALGLVRELLAALPRAALEAPDALGALERALVQLAGRLEQLADARIATLPPPDRLAWREHVHGDVQLQAEEHRRVAFQLRIIAREPSALPSPAHAADFVVRVEALIARIDLGHEPDPLRDERWDAHLA